MWCHITIDLFSLIVEDHRLCFVDAKLYILTPYPDLPEVRSAEDQSCDYLSTSRSLPSITEVWPSVIYLEYCGFCCIALSLPLKRLK